MEIRYVSWDPGGKSTKKSTGMVKWDEEGKPREVKELDQLELDKELDELEPTIIVFIIEEYVVYSHKSKAHIGSKLPTVQTIGQLKAYARKHGIKVIEQRSDIKKMASMWAQVKVPNGHMPDKMSAYLHGYYYLHRLGLIPAKVLEDYK